MKKLFGRLLKFCKKLVSKKPIKSVKPMGTNKSIEHQLPRSQNYYDTLGKELKSPRSFYNPRTGNTTHTFVPDDTNIVRVTNGNNKVLMSMDDGRYFRPSGLHKYVDPSYTNGLYCNLYWRPNFLDKYGWTGCI